MINPHIFREYDIRGIVGTDLTKESVQTLGKAFGTFFKQNQYDKISLTRDGRLSSPNVRDWLLEGILSTGLNVVDLGMAPTPLSYYSTYKLEIQGAIMITGSHNPSDYNGFKISSGREAIYGEQILKIKEIIDNGVYSKGKGEVSEYDLKPEYVHDLSERLSISRPVKVVLDAGNGVGGITLVPVLQNLGCEVISLFTEVDGRFPNHHPDPTVEKNLIALKEAVLKNNAELGIALDGDGDRIGIVDEKGNPLWGDQILSILGRELLSNEPGATIIAEVKCSQLLYDDIARHGGNSIMWKVGHSLIKTKMAETGALLAGEMSGHIFFKHRFYGFDDGTYVAGRFLEIVSHSSKPVSEFLSDWQKVFNTPEIRRECPDHLKFAIVDYVRDELSKEHQVIAIDGVRVNLPFGWGLLRASNTQPVVVMRFEADTEEHLSEIRELVNRTFQEGLTKLS